MWWNTHIRLTGPDEPIPKELQIHMHYWVVNQNLKIREFPVVSTKKAHVGKKLIMKMADS